MLTLELDLGEVGLELRLGSHGSGESLSSTKLDYAGLTAYDCVVIVTDHDYFKVEELLRHAPRVVDTRNLTGQLGREDPKVIKL